MEDLVAKRKKRLHDLLSTKNYASGVMIEEDSDQMMEMDSGEDDFLSNEDKESAIDPEDPITKAKARLFALMAPKFKKK